MAKPYSMDWRERVVSAVERDGMSRHAAAARYGVAISTAIRWVRRGRATGSVAPGQMGGHRLGILSGVKRDWLLERTARDFTLREAPLHAARTGRRAGDTRGEGRLCSGLAVRPRRGAELQKKACCPPHSCGPRSPNGASNGRSIRADLIRAASSSSTKPGPRPTWRRYAAGHHEARGSTPRCRTAPGAR